MNEFDLRSYLYNNPLLESEAKLKAAKKKLEKKEDKLDAIDMKDEDAKEKAKHHKDAIKNVKKEIKDLERDLKFDEKAEKKEEKEAKKKKAMKEGMGKYYEDDDMKEEMDSKYEEDDMKEGMGKSYYEDDDKKKMTKEGLKSMIREKITSILSEQEDVDVEKDVDVDVKDEEDVDVDIEKDVEVDDKSEEAEIEVDAEVAGQSADASGLEGLLKKARELAKEQGDDKLVRQISNTIIQHERSMAAGEEEMNEGEVNEKFLGIGSDVKTGSTLGIGTDKGGLIFSKLGKGRYKLIHPTSHPSFREGEIWKPRQDEKTLKVGQSFPGLGDIEGLRVDGESRKKVKT